MNPQEIRPSQILIVWPFASKRVIEKNNSNKNLSAYVPTVASVRYFIRNDENYLGNPVPTGIAVIKKKNPNGRKEPSLLTILSITKPLPLSRVLLVMTQVTYFDSFIESLALLIY